MYVDECSFKLTLSLGSFLVGQQNCVLRWRRVKEREFDSNRPNSADSVLGSYLLYFHMLQDTVQQVQAGWREAVLRPIEASLTEQEEIWSTRANTHNSLPPGYRVPFTLRLKVCPCVCVCLYVSVVQLLHLYEFCV